MLSGTWSPLNSIARERIAEANTAARELEGELPNFLLLDTTDLVTDNLSFEGFSHFTHKTNYEIACRLKQLLKE